MSWSTVIWSMVAATSLTMALPHLIIGLRHRAARANLLFALACFAVAALAAAEFRIIHATTPAESGRALQLAHVPVAIVAAAIIGYVYFYFGTARLWLGVLAAGLRAICLIPNFLAPPNLNFSEITGLRSYSFFGETLTIPVGTPSPWLLCAYLSSILLVVFIIDASVRLWRRGTPDGRRRAVVVGGGVVFFVVVAQTLSVLINAGLIAFPFMVSIPFLAIIAAMGFELSYDVIRAARLTEELKASTAALREGEERMSLAAESAHLSLWQWDIARDEVWMTEDGRALLGLPRDGRLNLDSLGEGVHPEDRAARTAAIRQAVATGGSYEMEYRVLRDDGRLQWMAARGRCAPPEGGKITRVLGISLDITRQKQADAEARQQRDELGRLARVALIGEMSTSIAHELNQPLTAIVANAGAAQRFLAQGNFKVDDLRESLADIAADGRRAGDVIRGIKGLVRKVEGQRGPVDLNTVITEVLRLLRSDALAQGCAIAHEPAPVPSLVNGDPVQLQQVLLNLILNAFDAMRQTPAESRRVEIRTRLVEAGAVEVAVRDFGPGLPPDAPARVFERFYSTKQEGMGMGLAIARSIIEAHGGTLDAENVGAERACAGACFWFRLPVRVDATGNNS